MRIGGSSVVLVLGHPECAQCLTLDKDFLNFHFRQPNSDWSALAMTRPKRLMGVRWGPQELVLQRGESVKTGFLVNGLAALLMVLLTATHVEARTKRSQSAKVEFKQQHPCPATGLPKGPCKGYVIDHIVPIVT